jgi:hypothetical protein
MLEIFDADFHRLGIINNCSFAQYVINAISVGSFSFKCEANSDNIELVKQNRIIWLEDDVAGIIQYVYFESEQSITMEVKGKLVGEILNWRYIYPAINVNLPLNKAMEKYVNETCINNKNTKRNYNFLEIQYSDFSLDKISKSTSGDTVEETLEEITSSDGYNKMLRFNVGFYPRKNKMVFYVKKGEDRTKGNASGNKPVLFSQDLKNIIKSEYTLNDEEYRNVALVAGEDSGTDRKTLIVSSEDEEASGFYRRELFVDARDIQSEQTTEGDDEMDGAICILTDEEYNELLKQRGLEKLGEKTKVESYEGEVSNDAEATFHYGIDYFLGDKVDVIDRQLQLKLQAIVTSVTITESGGEYSVEPSFGFTQPTIYQKLKKKGAL